jgi:hypothetical protein
MPRRSRRAEALQRWLVLAALTALVVACGAAPKVDGIPIGERVDCGGGSCDAEIAFARSWLDAAAPGHAPVRQVEIHAADYRNANGEHILLARTGGPTVAAVLRLEDGTIRAVLIGCGIGIDPETCMVIDPPADAS